MMAEVDEAFDTDRSAINKNEIARRLLTRLTAGLERRVLRLACEWEENNAAGKNKFDRAFHSEPCGVPNEP